jgi:hypothetical protein
VKDTQVEGDEISKDWRERFQGASKAGPQRQNYNVPTLGHHHSAEVYDDQSSQMDVIASTGVIERHCGV